MDEAALDLAGCARIAIRRFHRLATDPEARQRLLAVLTDAADGDPGLRNADLLADGIAGTATGLPPSCAAAMVVSRGKITKILIPNRPGLARTADICVHRVAAAIVNRAGQLGLVSRTSRQIEALALLAGAQGIAAGWRFVAVRGGALRDRPVPGRWHG